MIRNKEAALRDAQTEQADAFRPTLAHLKAANRSLVVVAREDTLRQAETQMLLNDYSQLPVMTGERTVHGFISWKSIGGAHVVGKAGPRVVDCMDPAYRLLPADLPLLEAVDKIIQHEVVLVMDASRKVIGIWPEPHPPSHFIRVH